MPYLSPRVAYELKRAAFDPSRHLDRNASKESRRTLINTGLAVEHHDGCVCGWYVLTDAGVELAATEYGITAPSGGSQVAR